ncbi:uncharacterized protein PgNI_02184 [Pyricularia grisea]|uniref:Uncharacterized protein n=1 Tax=Pyricularia grisea TaxID=148305 RepID=A0A6P8BG50_PYRGI|nr:uncharacterized protein PgNI_02184 [Pyricularia grisea]TLD15609.1 hypothetical protein PgNI_02184 [Pyricularia grisea]
MDTGGKGKVTLDGAQETLMLTLLARAVDAESSDSILNDAFSVKIRDQIRDEYSYNFGARAAPALHLGHMAKMVSSRAKIFDEATERFLQQNLGPATVLHIACGAFG